MLFPFSGEQKCYLLFCFQTSFDPNFIYSWSISHIFNMNSSVSAVWAAQGSKEKKVFNWAKKKKKIIFFENTVGSTLKVASFQKVRFVFQISQTIPKNYLELEIWISCLKFGLSEKHTKFEKIFLMVWTFTK